MCPFVQALIKKLPHRLGMWLALPFSCLGQFPVPSPGSLALLVSFEGPAVLDAADTAGNQRKRGSFPPGPGLPRNT